MYTSKEARQLDDYLRQVCQAIEKYDTQELLAYLAHGRWSVITEKERLDIEKESTKELKLLMLRRIIGPDKRRIDKMREVLITFASNIHREVVAVLAGSGNTSANADVTPKRSSKRRYQSKPRSETEVFPSRTHLDDTSLENCYSTKYYECKWSEFGPPNSFAINDSHCVIPEERLTQKKREMALPLEEAMQQIHTGNSKLFKGSRASSSDSINSSSDLSGSPMDCSQVLTMETNKEGRLRQTQSDIDSGYRSMTTLPLGLTQSSVSTRPSFYINDPELPLLSQPLTYLSSSESCISDSRPQSRLRHAEQGMNVFPVKEPHSLQRLRPSPTRSQQQMCREIEEKQLSTNRQRRHSNLTHGVLSNVSQSQDEESMWEHTGVRSLEPYSLTVEDKILKRNNGDLMQYMNMPALLPHLYENSLVTLQEYQTLSLDNTTAFDKHGYFLQSVLPHKGPDAFERLLKCFRDEEQHTGHKYLAGLLEIEQAKDSPTVSQS